MPIVPLARMLADAISGGYGVCYCESWNLESMQAVVQAAEECHSPVIAGFNGGFLRHCSREQQEQLAYYAGFQFALERSPVPIAFLLNESDSLEQIQQGIALGFNAVMPDNEGLDTAAYRRVVQQVVALAHPHNVWVEAQVGVLPNGAHPPASGRNGNGDITDPAMARRFVEETAVDALAVSIGNIHVLTSGKATVDFDALRRLRDSVHVPLVLHGGTSLDFERLQDLASLGVAKFNFGTLLKQAYLEALGEKLACYQPPLNPHKFLGMGGESDIMVAGRQAVKAKVKELLRASGSAGRA